MSIMRRIMEENSVLRDENRLLRSALVNLTAACTASAEIMDAIDLGAYERALEVEEAAGSNRG